MNKEYEIVYCKECNEIKLTDSDWNCLGCNNPAEVIGFTHEVVQSILDVEAKGELSNE